MNNKQTKNHTKCFLTKKLNLNQADGFHAFIIIDSQLENTQKFSKGFQSMKSAISTASRIPIFCCSLFILVLTGKQVCLQSTLAIFYTTFFLFWFSQSLSATVIFTLLFFLCSAWGLIGCVLVFYGLALVSSFQIWDAINFWFVFIFFRLLLYMSIYFYAVVFVKIRFFASYLPLNMQTKYSSICLWHSIISRLNVRFVRAFMPCCLLSLPITEYFWGDISDMRHVSHRALSYTWLVYR